ncbi:hypothetical protein [Isoptericola variabilis]|uniref:Uncharacterized protein n=1 Tax=Isoptericola variabilis (strain 225) TaxID=743718 RepID=F6FSU5_ISOV2|nr:hypothetical protein [Isoptericola variabilis]AEG43086.1 hypothetical protein Isova_0284 [Isoptericola variabilis 225]TWH35013.1 hypothetical protein L600_000100000170 [Isoptericola variabilis J7]
MSYVQALVPAEHASKHLLVLPEGAPASLPDLAGAWFADVGWLHEPVQESRPRRIAGARFRGVQSAAAPAAPPGPGRLSVGAEHCADGPFPVTADQVAHLGLTGPGQVWALGRADGMVDVRGARPGTYDDRDGIARAFASALPEGEELRLVQWAVAVARKVGGAVLADGRQVMRPDPSGAVDLSLYSAHPVGAGDMLAALRTLVATAQLEAEETAPDGSTRYRLVGATPYDGALVVQAERVERVPRALVTLDWREYGPFAYHLGWRPHDPYELQVEQPSGVHVIARARMRSMVARLALLLHSRVHGTLVDDAGFVATAQEVGRRTDDAAPTRAWV